MLAAADRLTEDTTPVLCPSGAHLHHMLYRVLQAVYTVVTPGRFVPPNPMQEPPEMTVSGEDLSQAQREDAVASLKSLLEEGPYHRDCGVPSTRLR